jgi:hypothetical protein
MASKPAAPVTAVLGPAAWVWPDQFAVGDLPPPALQRGEITAHVADGGDAICNQEREERRLAPFRIGGYAGEVHMHVAQTRDEKFSAAIDHPRAIGWRRLADGGDSITRNEDGAIQLGVGTRAVDDRDVSEGEGAGLRASSGAENE